MHWNPEKFLLTGRHGERSTEDISEYFIEKTVEGIPGNRIRYQNYENNQTYQFPEERPFPGYRDAD